MKNSFVLYYDLEYVFDFLSDEEAGRMIKAVLKYEIKGERTDFDDRMMSSTFQRIADSLDRNKKRYEQTCFARREAANQRWHPESEVKMPS